MVYNQNSSYWVSSYSVISADSGEFSLQVSKQDFKVDPLPLVNYKISTSLPLSALLSSRDCVGGKHTPRVTVLSLGSLHLCEEHYYFALQVASLQNE